MRSLISCDSSSRSVPVIYFSIWAHILTILRSRHSPLFDRIMLRRRLNTNIAQEFARLRAACLASITLKCLPHWWITSDISVAFQMCLSHSPCACYSTTACAASIMPHPPSLCLHTSMSHNTKSYCPSIHSPLNHGSRSALLGVILWGLRASSFITIERGHK